jgi:putative aminopeptidase FrvX
LNDLQDLLKILVEANGVSGYEADVRGKIRKLIPREVESKVDSIGNLIASIGSGQPSIILIAHMDELGFLVSNVEDNGYVRSRKVGSFDDRYLPGKIFQIHSAGTTVEGVNEIPLGAGPTGGMTDGLPLQEKGIPMVPITIPIRYMHSPVEMCHRKDLERLIELLAYAALEI